MNRNRSDLSNWIIHFVHDRNVSLEPEKDFDDWPFTRFVHSYNYDGEAIINEYPLCHDFELDDNATAFEVLQKIIICGYLKGSYAFRRNKNGDIVPTIYGPKPAVCFTEMPFGSFLDYTKSRNDKKNITPYGIAFHRTDLFNLGARPVIYGLSVDHKESSPEDIFYRKGHRTLHSSTGIGLKEQYRYVYTQLAGKSPTDWTHEREWRWADITEKYDTPGLPFLLQSLSYNLNSIFVMVKTEEEVGELQDLAQRLYHQEANYAGDSYKLHLLAETRFISLEALAKNATNLEQVRFEDFSPLKVIRKLYRHKPSATLKAQVKKEVEESLKFLDDFDKQTSALHSSSDADRQMDSFAFMSIITYEASTEVTQAMLDIGYLKVDNEAYIVSHERLGHKYTPYFTRAVEAFEKIAEQLTVKLNQKFYCHYKLDGE